MAGKIVYQGELFEDLGAKLESMAAAMEISTTAITNLLSVTTAQTVDMAVIASDTVKVNGINTKDLTANNAPTKVMTIMPFCTGTIKVKLRYKTSTSNGSYPAKIYTCIEGGSNVERFSTTSTSYVDVSFTQTVKAGQSFAILSGTLGTSYATTIENASVKICYDFNDVVTNGAITSEQNV